MPNRGGSRPGAGRPRTSPGWHTVSIRIPRPLKTAWDLLDESVRGEVREGMRALITGALKSPSPVTRS